MVLAPADFYAYSRATGAPVPQTPEERAQIATDVLEFRRNQLKAPEEKPDTLKAIGAATLAVAGALGAGFGAKKFLDRRAQIAKGPAKSATAGVRQVDLNKIRDVEAATQVDLTQVQQSTAPLQRDQTFEALDSGQAQMEQRVEMGVRRNEDIDTSQYAALKQMADENEALMRAEADPSQMMGYEPDASANIAASKLPDGRPLDQAETSFKEFSQRAQALADAEIQRVRELRASSASPTTSEALMSSSLSKDEVADRIMAAANFGENTLERSALLDPNVPASAVEDLLGSTWKEGLRGGMQRNLPQEVGRNRGMVSLDDLAQSREDFPDVTGIETTGAFVDTETYRERTNKGTTLIPGSTFQAEGAVAQSGRQERFGDRQIPVRATTEGDPSRGVRWNPEKNRYELEGAATGRVLGSPDSSTDINISDTKLRGGFEPADPKAGYSSRQTISRVPVLEYLDQPQVVQGESGQLYQLSGKTKISPDKTAPLTGLKGMATTTGSYVFGKPGSALAQNQTQNFNLNVNLLRDAAASAKDTYFNNPTTRNAFLGSKGKTLDSATGLDYKDFMIQDMNRQLENQGIRLDILQQKQNKAGTRYYGADTHAFVDSFLGSTTERDVYGQKLMVNKKTGNLEPVGEVGPIPELGAKVRGFGGMDPMLLDDASEYAGPVSFNNPRVGGVTPQRVLAQGAGVPGAPDLSTQVVRPSATGAEMESLRQTMAQQSDPAPRRSRSNVDFVGGEEMAKIQEGLLAKAKRRQAKARS